MKYKNYKNSAEQFNDLSHVPPGLVDLGDGRKLAITGWAPSLDMRDPKREVDSVEVDVVIKGFIYREEEE